MKSPRLLVLFFATSLAGQAVGDIVHLKDGTQVDGEVKHSDDGWLVRANGKAIHLSSDQVDSIELTCNAVTGTAAAAERLGSLRRSVEAMTDLNKIVLRFQHFVDSAIDPTATTEAKKDLTIWNDRLRNKMVKVGSRWVLPADRPKLLEQAAVSIDQARQLMKQGRSQEADALLDAAMRIDPQNPAGLFLEGVLRYHDEQLPAARKSFEAVAAVMPNHAATLNNLAVVLWRQHQPIASLSNYDAAMIAAPVNKQILDNVASTLLVISPELQKSPVTAKTLRHFQEQDQILSEQMAQVGMHRYGAVWASDADMVHMTDQENVIQSKLDALAGDFDLSKNRIDQIDQTITDTRSQMRRMEVTNIIADPITGIATQIAYPQLYYDLGGNLQRLQQDRATELTKLDEIKRQADDLQRNQLSRNLRGTQRIFGVEGTPLRITPAPTTQP